MNYNVKRFTQPLKGICSCNYAAVKSIANLANNNTEYRQYNKGFFIRQLGEVMDRIDHSKGCELIEPVVPSSPEKLTKALLVDSQVFHHHEETTNIYSNAMSGPGFRVMFDSGGKCVWLGILYHGNDGLLNIIIMRPDDTIKQSWLNGYTCAQLLAEFDQGVNNTVVEIIIQIIDNATGKSYGMDYEKIIDLGMYPAQIGGVRLDSYLINEDRS